MTPVAAVKGSWFEGFDNDPFSYSVVVLSFDLCAGVVALFADGVSPLTLLVGVGAAAGDCVAAATVTSAIDAGRAKSPRAVTGVGVRVVGEVRTEGACVIISAIEANLRLILTVPIESFLGDTEVISRTLRTGEVGVEGSGLLEYAIISPVAGGLCV